VSSILVSVRFPTLHEGRVNAAMSVPCLHTKITHFRPRKLGAASTCHSGTSLTKPLANSEVAVAVEAKLTAGVSILKLKLSRVSSCIPNGIWCKNPGKVEAKNNTATHQLRNLDHAFWPSFF